ncbi:cytochrome P-450 cyp509A1 [Backusella circina FSU 941]|nr:cytochrome P-450 cyp509A1 [Backusella circina FSU 941]
MHQRYGRAGWEIHTSSPEAIKKVFLNADLFPKETLNTKSLRHSLLYKFFGKPNILTLNGNAWKEHRKLANPAFQRSMPVITFGQLTQQLFTEIDRNEVVEITDLMTRLTLDAIGKAGFDFDFGSLTDKDNEYVKNYHSIMQGIRNPLFFLFPILESKFLWMFPKRQRVHDDLDQLTKMIEGIIDKKRLKIQNGEENNLQENEKDLLSLMLESEFKGEGKLTTEELTSTICIFFAAGHETTAYSLSSALYHLAKHPEIQQRAREEVIQILGDEPNDVLPTIKDTQNMAFVNQIIKEVLRMNPPITSTFSRKATEDCDISGYFIPKDTRVIVNVLEAHYSEKNWTDPFVFNPDRFTESEKIQSMTWIPFGSGVRQCIGLSFSLVEQRVVLSMLLRKYTWVLPDDSIHQESLKTKGQGLVGPIDLDIKFKRRY